jgi:hypothetical protein
LDEKKAEADTYPGPVGSLESLAMTEAAYVEARRKRHL